MFLLPATPDEIRGTIHNLKHSSSGWDGIKPFVLMHSFSNLLDPLCYIVNLSFDQGCVPDQLKLAEVIPVLKLRHELVTPGRFLSCHAQLFKFFKD